MKKTILIVVLVIAALGALGIGVALAQSGRPPYSGSGMMGGGYGWMHDYVEQALAAKLGITEETVEKELATKPMYQIALDHGIKQADLATFMDEVHKDAFAKAVKDGVITQQQADWMLQHMHNGVGNGGCPMWNVQSQPSTNGTGYGPGMMNGFGRGGMMGGGWGGPKRLLKRCGTGKGYLIEIIRFTQTLGTAHHESRSLNQRTPVRNVQKIEENRKRSFND